MLEKGLEVTLEIEYPAENAAYMLLKFKNTGSENTYQIQKAKTLDVDYKTGTAPLYHGLSGDYCGAVSYLPREFAVTEDYHEEPTGGRSSDRTGFPYFDLTWEQNAVVFGIGWTGQPVIAKWPSDVRNSMTLDQARKDQKNMKEVIVAGMDGTVTYVSEVKTGQRSKEGELFITISDMTTTAFTVEGADAELFPVGEKMTITKGSTEYAAVSVEAAVLGMESLGEDEKPVAYLMLERPDPTLKSGDIGSIKLVQESSMNTLYVNKNAVKTADGKQFVYVLNEAGHKVMQDVTVGLTSGSDIEITSGLEEGDRVVVE